MKKPVDRHRRRWYYENLHEDIIHHAGRWALEEKGLSNVEHAMTNNPSESLNAVYLFHFTYYQDLSS
jgi:hypothetical protein